MKKRIYPLSVALIALFLSGCYSTGLSMRERGSVNYTNFVYGLYDDDSLEELKSAKLEKPIKLAVAQVGENTPPEAMLNVLAEKRYLISKLEIIPAGGSEGNYYSNQQEPAKEEFSKRMKGMLNLAKSLGTDYIFLFGGSADYGSTANWLQVFDITIVGGYILPSNKIKAEGRAAGALIDVQSGKVLFVVNAEANKKAHTPTFISYEKGEDVVVELRDELIKELADNFVSKLAARE